MQITTRPFQDTDLGRCLEIERAAVRSNHYLNDVIDYYRTTKGEFTLALADNFPAGMGKLTVLYDGSAWLELLRVHPDFQRQGMGKAIYRRYLEQVAAFGCPSARMYTGVKNVASAALAEQFGLHRGPEFRGMSLPVQDDSFQPQPKPLHLLGGEEATEHLLPLQEKTGGFLSINHTFYKLNRSTCFGFAAAGLGLWRRGGQRPCLWGAFSAAKGAVHRGPCRPRQSQKGERALLCLQPCGNDRRRKADRPFPESGPAGAGILSGARLHRRPVGRRGV